jgi:hypothetical protein
MQGSQAFRDFMNECESDEAGATAKIAFSEKEAIRTVVGWRGEAIRYMVWGCH